MGERPKISTKDIIYGKVSRARPDKLIFTGNFTRQCRHFHVMPERGSTRRDILNSVMKRTECVLTEQRDADSLNLLYEDPRDVIGDKPPKPSRQRTIQGLAATSPRNGKEGRSLLRDQKRKLTKKYESLITALMDKCEEHAALISDKDGHIGKLKEKLKAVLEYNRLFADENDRLRAELARAARRPDAEQAAPSAAVPLVEVCASCGGREVLLQQARDQNGRLQRDMIGLKDVLYRLNVQLSRYQEKIRSLSASAPIAATASGAPGDPPESLAPPPPTPFQPGARAEAERVVEPTGLLSARALVPLFDAYQENLQEKDELILDYEKQFESMNKKSKRIVEENEALSGRVAVLEEELERAARDRRLRAAEHAELAARAERAEGKLKEVYEQYEHKMAALARDYETVHREYFAARSVLGACAWRGARSVPAELHERRLDHCKRLLEELKAQYGADGERRAAQLAELRAERDAARDQLAAALGNVELYREAATVFRRRARAAAARAARVARAARAARGRRRGRGDERLRRALDALERIKVEIKEVKSRARGSLEELERRIVQQERRAAAARRELRRRGDVIRSLVHGDGGPRGEGDRR